MAEQTLILGEKTDASFWAGALLIDPAFVVGGGSAYLRYLQGQSDNVRIRLSSTATDDPFLAGPDLVPEWEDYAEALTFEADGAATVVLKGPANLDNSYDDPSEPYHWIPDNGDAWETFWQDANAKHSPHAQDVRPSSARCNGNPRWWAWSGRYLGPLPPSVIRRPCWQRASLDGWPMPAVSVRVATLGGPPPVVATATLDAGLLGSISGAASLGQAIAVTATATLTGGLTGSISGAATIADATRCRVGSSALSQTRATTT